MKRHKGRLGTCLVGQMVHLLGGPPHRMLKEGVERRRGSLVGREGSTRINYLQMPEFLVMPLLTGLVCLISQGQFEEPVRPCSSHFLHSCRHLNDQRTALSRKVVCIGINGSFSATRL